MVVGRGGSRRGGAERGADAVADFFGDETGFACVVKADLFGDVVDRNMIFTFQGDLGDPAALESCRVDQPVRHRAQVVVMCGGFRQPAGLLPVGASGAAQSQAAGRLVVAAHAGEAVLADFVGADHQTLELVAAFNALTRLTSPRCTSPASLHRALTKLRAGMLTTN
ncbi:hypothetical protein ACLQ18_41380 [Streptomyces sp. DT193]|uniref:hypothetical protein n=1 Tax=Streptomyces sp. DT193 TaxID=3393418 RepID=UPI003CF184A2